MKLARAGSVSAGVFEQFTQFQTLRADGRKVPNEAHQLLTSSITQVYGRYDLSDEVGLRLNVPIIARHFRRPEGDRIRTGDESGIGDLAALALYTPLQLSDGDLSARIEFRAGVKFPTGDASRLAEEGRGFSGEGSDEDGGDSLPEKHGGHHHDEGMKSAIHGHDLALGTGSFDYIVGVGASVEKERVFALIESQFALRSEGSFDYRYQNDLLWSLGLGYYLLTAHEGTAALRANLTGENKGTDIFRGTRVNDTGINSIFLGPQLDFTIGERLHGLLAVDLPVLTDNTGLQVVPTYRLRMGVTYRFS